MKLFKELPCLIDVINKKGDIKMKLMNVLLTTTLAIALLGTGCSVDKNEVPPVSNEPSSGQIIVSDLKEEKTFLDTALELLSQTHEDSSRFFESSEELLSADGVYVIGRSFPVTAFGIDTTLYASLDANNIVNSISVHLGEDNFDAIKEELVNQLGEATEINDVPSEGGFTSMMWSIEGKYVYLYQGYATVDLQLILPDQVKTSVIDEDFSVQLPNTITPLLGESTPYPLLQEFIIDTYDIPEDYYSKTKYYYNYVDFNGDGHDEIFAVVMGPYTSGTGGSSAFIAFEFDGQLQAITNFTLIHTPVIISDQATKGMQDIIVMKAGGGAEATFVKLTSTGEGHYTSVNAGEIINDISNVHGRAIIANDLMYDSNNSLYLTLE